MKRSVLILACLGALGTAGVAEAASPPNGTYDCKFHESGRTYGLLKIASGTSYRFNRTKRGRYRTSGRKITFTSGPMKGAFENAVWKRSDGLVYINLYDGPEFGRSQTDAQCIKRKGS